MVSDALTVFLIIIIITLLSTSQAFRRRGGHRRLAEEEDEGEEEEEQREECVGVVLSCAGLDRMSRFNHDHHGLRGGVTPLWAEQEDC